MPARDGTGPLGYGPKTGRGFGPCGRGLRRGQRLSEPVTLGKEEERKILEAEKQEIERRLEELG